MANQTDDWMPLRIGVYLSNTTKLTRDQHGAYLLLLMAYWTNGGPLDADDGELAATVKATPNEWKKLKPVMLKFFTEQDGKWVQTRADEELQKARDLVAKKSSAGKKGAENRWQTNQDANGTRMADASFCQKQTDAPIPKPSPIPKQLKEISSFVVGRAGLGRDGVTIRDPNERIARFQKKIAQAIGKDGWMLVAAASDPQSPEHERALEVCKAAAERIGKGWPRNWPSEIAA